MIFRRHKLLIVGLALVAGFSVHWPSQATSQQTSTAHPAIQYEQAPINDAVTRLQQRLASRQTKLTYDKYFGWLPALLQAFEIPVSSQILTFGKTSFQAPLISPQRPRALYFNDHISVGFIPNSPLLEIAAIDPKQGVVFYTISQDAPQPRLQRDNSCLQCHEGNATARVPGWFLRSIYPEPDGQPIFRAGGFVTDYRSPLAERWGGWYVTGTHGAQRHMGNAFARDPKNPEWLDSERAFNLTALEKRFDTTAYLTPHSDIVALMTIEHQARVANLITAAGWETRKALHDRNVMIEALGELTETTAASTQRRLKSACDPLVEALLFVGEAPLTEPVRGTSGFAERFAERGPRDAQGRSLRQFDLTRRLMRYSCSFLIYSDAFDALPSETLTYVYQQMWDILNAKEPPARFAHLSATERLAIKEILQATKTSLPSYWTTGAARQ